MAIGDNSYGSVAEVEALTTAYTTDGNYTTGTRPTQSQVETFIDRISAILNVILAGLGFEIPIAQADVVLMLAEFVTDHAAYLCHGTNRAGPYAPGSEQLRGRSPFEIIRKEAEAFLEKHASGLAALGATRDRALSYGLGCRTETDSGTTLEPPFQRTMLGDEIADWDAG